MFIVHVQIFQHQYQSQALQIFRCTLLGPYFNGFQLKYFFKSILTSPGPVSYQCVQTGTASPVIPDYTVHELGG